MRYHSVWYRKCETQARVFPQSLAYRNSENEIRQRRNSNVRKKERSRNWPVVVLVWCRTAEPDVLGSNSGLDSCSRTETSSLSRVVRVGGDPCSEPLSGWKKVILRKRVHSPQHIGMIKNVCEKHSKQDLKKHTILTWFSLYKIYNTLESRNISKNCM